MISNTLKTALYDKGFTITDVAAEAETTPRVASSALGRWEGKMGTPYGATRRVLKLARGDCKFFCVNGGES